jgi:hypothetical protein
MKALKSSFVFLILLASSVPSITTAAQANSQALLPTDGTIDYAALTAYFGYPIENGKCVDQHTDSSLRDLQHCKMLIRNLERDTSFCSADPKTVLEQSPPANAQINGKLKFMGLFPHPYRYTIEKDADGKFVIALKIKIRNLTDPYDLWTMRWRLGDAEKEWNKFNPSPDHFRFSFKIVDDEKDADFVVDLKTEDSRGPYNKRWSLQWSYLNVFHEVGHMMGLDDEYPQFTATVLKPLFYTDKVFNQLGDPDSIMYGDDGKHTKTAYPYHYYLIFRRAFCQ